MQETTNHEWAELLSAEPIPLEHNPIRKLRMGFLDPSEMTPEQRMDAVASILAMGFLRLKSGVVAPEPMPRHKSRTRIVSSESV